MAAGIIPLCGVRSSLLEVGLHDVSNAGGSHVLGNHGSKLRQGPCFSASQ